MLLHADARLRPNSVVGRAFGDSHARRVGAEPPSSWFALVGLNSFSPAKRSSRRHRPASVERPAWAGANEAPNSMTVQY